MGGNLANFSVVESKLKRLKLFNTKNNHDLTGENYLRHINIQICSELENAANFLLSNDRCLLLEEFSITDVNGHISAIETQICSSVRNILAHRPASRLRKVALDGVEVNPKSTWTSFLVDWVRNRFLPL